MKKFIYLVFALLIFTTTLSSHAALRIITTTQDLASITEMLGGDHVQVLSLTPGTRDPHFAAAKPSMIHKASQADLLILIGAGLEVGWLPALIRSARNNKIQPGNTGYLDISTNIPLLGKINGPVTRAMGDVHAKGNPHYWLDPRNGIRITQAIAKRLSELDPANSNVYLERSASFTESIKNKFIDWKEQLLSLKDKPVIAYHKSYIYLADAFEFRIVDEVEPKPGIAPSASSLAALISRIRKENIKLLIMEPFYEQRSARYLNEQTGIRIVILPQSVGSLPGINSYIDLFDAIVSTLTDKQGS